MQFRKVRGFDAGRVFRFGLLVLGMWASSPIAGFAQGEASIQGIVTDASGGALPSVAIRIKNLETGAQRNLWVPDRCAWPGEMVGSGGPGNRPGA